VFVYLGSEALPSRVRVVGLSARRVIGFVGISAQGLLVCRAVQCGDLLDLYGSNGARSVGQQYDASVRVWVRVVMQ